MKHQIINNFMDPVLYSSIRDTLTGNTFWWSYVDHVDWKPSEEEYHFQTEIVRHSTLLGNFYINYLNMVKPALEKIPHKKIHSLSFYMLTKRPKILKYPITKFKEDSKLCLLFGNQSDGGIEIDGETIESKENTLVSFSAKNKLSFMFPVKYKITTFVLINYNE